MSATAQTPASLGDGLTESQKSSRLDVQAQSRIALAI